MLMSCAASAKSASAITDLDARVAQALQTCPGHLGERVFQSGDHAAYAGLDQRVAARWCASMVGAGLQRHPSGGTPYVVSGRFCSQQRLNFSVVSTGFLGGPFTQHMAVVGADHAADPRIGVREAKRRSCQCQRTLHAQAVQASAPFARAHVHVKHSVGVAACCR